MKYSDFKRSAYGRMCRRCMNENYHLSLEPTDCQYLHFPSVCSGCNEVRNIVIKIRFMKRFALRKV